MMDRKTDASGRRGMGKWLICAALAALPPAYAAAQQKTLYVGMNGGDMARAFTEHVFPDFEQAYGVKIVVVPGTSTEVLAKAQTQKDKPRMHLMFLEESVLTRAISEELCEPLREDPVLKELYPTSLKKGRMAAGIGLGMTGLGYNTRIFAQHGWAPPTSWLDLADPKYKGKVVFQSAASSTFGLHAFLMFNRIKGGTDRNLEPGFRHWPTTIGPNVAEYIPNSGKLADMIQSGQAAIFPMTSTGVDRMKRRGVPVEYVQPKEGAVILLAGECVVAGNSEPDLSQKLALYMLSTKAQAQVLEWSRDVPSNKNVRASAADAEMLKRFQGYMANAKILDWDQINAARPAFNARWNRMIGQ